MYAHLLSPVPLLAEKRPELPPEVDKVIERVMAKSPQDRYATGGELMDGFQKAVGLPREPLGAPTAAPGGGRAPGRRRRMLVAGALALVLVAVAITVAVVATKGGGKPASTPSTGIPIAARYSLQRIDPGASRPAARIGVNLTATAIAVSDEGTVWAGDGSHTILQRLDPRTGRVTSIRVPEEVSHVAYGVGALWFTSDSSSQLFRVDPATNRVTQIDLPGTLPTSIAVDEATGSLWVAEQRDCGPTPCKGFPCYEGNGGRCLLESLTRIDARTEEVSGMVNLPTPIPVTAGLVTGNRSLWVATTGPTVYHIDESRGEVVGDFEVGGGIGGMAFDMATDTLWVTVTHGGLAGTLVKVSPDDRIVDRISASCCPGTVAVAGGVVWVTDANGGTVSQVSLVSDEVTQIVSVGKVPVALGAGRDSVWVGVERA